MKELLKLLFEIVLVGIISCFVAGFSIATFVMGSIVLHLPLLPTCTMEANPSVIFTTCKSVYSYSLELFFVLAMIWTITVFMFLFWMVFKKKK